MRELIDRLVAEVAASSPTSVSESARSHRTSLTTTGAVRTGRGPRSCRAERRRRASSPRRARRRSAASSPGRSGESHRAHGHLLALDAYVPEPRMITLTSSCPDPASLCSRPSMPGGELEPVDPERLARRARAGRTAPRRPGPSPRSSRRRRSISHSATLASTSGRRRSVVSGIGAFSAAEMPSASTRRVSSGSMMPSSQSRAVE